MAKKNNNNLFFTCSLIEYIGRNRKQHRREITDYLGRLIEDIYDDAEIEKGIWDIYHSWIDAHISDYNTDFYYQPRDYIAACYKAGEIL